MSIYNTYIIHVTIKYRWLSDCPTPPVLIPEGNDSTVENVTITTDKALLTLTLELDYEVGGVYLLVMMVTDYLKTPVESGVVTVKVSDLKCVIKQQ